MSFPVERPMVRFLVDMVAAAAIIAALGILLRKLEAWW